MSNKNKQKNLYELSKSEIDRDVLNRARIPKGLKVKTVKEKILPNIKYKWVVRGSEFDKLKQKHTKVYSIVDIINYINKKIQEHNNKKH